MNCVARYIERQKITHRELADRVGVSQPTVSDWVNGKKAPSRDSLPRLSAELGMRPSRILADFYDASAAAR